MPTYRELMDAAANADKSGDVAGAKRLVELAQQEQQTPVAEQPQIAPIQQPSQYTEAMTAAARAGGMGGLGMSAPILPEYGPDVIRYGVVPVGTAILTRGRSAIPTLVGNVLTSTGGEFLAQATEKSQGTIEEFAPREVGAAGAAALAVPAKFAPKIAPGIINFLTNAGVNVGASELGRYIQKGEYEVPTLAIKDIGLRFGLPLAASALTSGVKTKASNLAETVAQRETISSGRFGGSVMASEILPQYTGLEAKVIADGNEFAIKALDNLDAEIGPTLAKAYEGAKDSAEIAAKLTPHVGELTKLQQSARLARDEANRLEAQAAEAIASQRSDALKLKADAKDAAMNAAAENYVYEQGKERIFGGVSQKIGTVVSGASMQNLRGIAKAAKESTEAGLGRIWTNAGVGLNDTIVTVDDITRSATKATAKGLGLEGEGARNEFIQVLGKTLDNLADESGNISLEKFRTIRDEFVRELTDKTKDANYAHRVASTSYDVIKDAANTYVEKNLPGQAEKWKFANAASAAIYKAKKSNVIDLIAEGDMDGVLSLMKKEGMAKPILAEIDAYAASIAGTKTRGAKYAAARFKQDTLDAMRDTLVEDSLNFGKGQDSAAKIVDFPKLITTLDELRQRKFPVELLDLGSADDIRKLARVATAGKEGGMTSDQFSKYIQNRKNFGAGAAAARTAYDKAYKDFLISNDVKTRANAAARMSKEAKAAGFKAGEIETAQIAAQSDPIIALLSDTKMGLSKDPAQNGKWIASLFSMSPSTVGQFVDKLKQSGRGALLEDIKKSAMADVMRDTFSKTQDVVNKKSNIKNVLNFFEGENGKQRSEILATLMGADEYSNFKKNFSEPIKKIVQTRESLAGRYPSPDDFVRPAISAKGLATGKATGATLFKTAYDNVKKLVDEQRYNLVYTLYVNPSTANAYAKSMYDMDKFISSSAANSMAIKLAMERDAQNQANQPAPQQQ
jgi:ElaB/YqjD/DUF883 family membrane-anchored ribosome-binding protein